jgi:hypothetical protein
MPASQEVQLHFVHKCVRQYVDDVVAAMDRSIRKRKIIDTDALRASLANTAESTPNGAIGKLIFNEYGRYVDMGVGRGRRLGGGIDALQEAIISTAGADRKKRGVKPRKFYSPIAYGKLNGLIEDIAYGLTDETIAVIKAELETKP